MPWELLHDGTEYVVHRTSLPLIPVRCVKTGGTPSPPKNRQLNVLFMAASPIGANSLDFEKEEALILEAAGNRQSLQLTVEESGNLAELGKLMAFHGESVFDLLHLTGHADIIPGPQPGIPDTPVFLFETLEGQKAPATGTDFAKQLPYRPSLVFLSGCRTGQTPGYGEVASLAEQLVNCQFPLVLGWGRAVRHMEASLAAKKLYEYLANGLPVPLGLLKTWQDFKMGHSRDWSLLRLFCAGDPRSSLVTPPKGRERVVMKLAEEEFLDPVTRKSKVADRSTFVGRRRLLQGVLKFLKAPVKPKVGGLLHGQGGRGKSSVAARVCDRLKEQFQRVVVIGRLNESTLIKAIFDALPREIPDQLSGLRKTLVDPNQTLVDRLGFYLEQLARLGALPPLFVMDDFEQNQPGRERADLVLDPEAAEALQSLIAALEKTGQGRVLITGRYKLGPPFEIFMESWDVVPLDDKERDKQVFRLKEKAQTPQLSKFLLEKAKEAADGNPQLLEWLYKVIHQPDLDQDKIFEEMKEKEEEFRGEILAGNLVASLDPGVKTFLERLVLLTKPIPRGVAKILAPEWEESALDIALKRCVDLGLIDIFLEESSSHYLVPRQLTGGKPPVLNHLNGGERKKWLGLAIDSLYQVWWVEPAIPDEGRSLELIRLAILNGDAGKVRKIARRLTAERFEGEAYRIGEIEKLIRGILKFSGRDPLYLNQLCFLLQIQGKMSQAGILFEEASQSENLFDSEILIAFFIDKMYRLIDEDMLEEAWETLEGQLKPLISNFGLPSKRLRGQKTLWYLRHERRKKELGLRKGMVRIEDYHRARYGEAGAFYEMLWEFKNLMKEKGKIANIFQSRGAWEEVLRIRLEEQLQDYEKQGDVHSLIIGQVNYALNLALRINPKDRQEVLQLLEWSLVKAREMKIPEEKLIEDFLNLIK